MMRASSIDELWNQLTGEYALAGLPVPQSDNDWYKEQVRHLRARLDEFRRSQQR